MKKYRFLGAILAGIMAISGVPEAVQPLGITASAASKLAAPANLKAAASGTTALKLTWSKVSGANAYRVYMYNSSTKKYETYKNVSGTSCTVKNLTAGKTYKFRVAALVKSGKSYAVQTKSSAVSVKLEKKTSSSSGKTPVVALPAFGTSVKKAFSSMGITQYYSAGELAEGITAYAGYFTMNGQQCMAFMYFNSDNKLFYSVAVIPKAAMKFSTALNNLKKAYGDKYVCVESSGMTLYTWSVSDNVGEVLFGSDSGENFMYGKMDRTLTPESMSSGGFDLGGLQSAEDFLS